jgi:phospholipid/cholesterol/gamma-HCH transport system substrate-binding protein
VILELPRRALAGLIVFAVVSVALFAFLLARFGGPSLQLHQPERVRVSFADAHGVGTGDDVLVRGVRIGRVGAVSQRGGRATVTLELGGGRPRLYADASAWVASKTPLGESFVALDPGHPRTGTLPPGHAPASRASVQIDEALAVLDAPARRDLRALLATTGAATADPQASAQIGDTLAGLDRAVAQLRAVGATLHGQSADIATAVQDGRAVLRELGDHDAAVRSIISDGRATLAALAAQRPALDRALALLPQIVGSARTTLAAADPLAREALPFAADLRRAAPPLSRSLVALRPALADTRALLDRAPALTAAALPALATLRAALPALARTSRALGPALRDVVPMVGYLAPRANTIAAWFSNTAALGQNGDAKGRWARFFVGFDPSTAIGGPGSPPGNAYTPPGDAAHNRAYRPGDFPRLEPYTP